MVKIYLLGTNASCNLTTTCRLYIPPKSPNCSTNGSNDALFDTKVLDDSYKEGVAAHALMFVQKRGWGDWIYNNDNKNGTTNIFNIRKEKTIAKNISTNPRIISPGVSMNIQITAWVWGVMEAS